MDKSEINRENARLVFSIQMGLVGITNSCWSFLAMHLQSFVVQPLSLRSYYSSLLPPCMQNFQTRSNNL